MTVDYSRAIALLQQSDPALAIVIEQVGECKLWEAQQSGDVLACITRAIIYQQLSGKAAGAIYQRFLQLYPERSLPTAEAILDTPDSVLREAGVSRTKAAYLKDLAQKVLDGLPTLAELELMD